MDSGLQERAEYLINLTGNYGMGFRGVIKDLFARVKELEDKPMKPILDAELKKRAERHRIEATTGGLAVSAEMYLEAALVIRDLMSHIDTHEKEFQSKPVASAVSEELRLNFGVLREMLLERIHYRHVELLDNIFAIADAKPVESGWIEGPPTESTEPGGTHIVNAYRK